MSCLFVCSVKDVSCPKEHEDRCGAGKGSGQPKSQNRRAQKEVGQSYGIDDESFAPAVVRKKDGVLSLQHLNCIHPMCPFIENDPRRNFGEAMKPQYPSRRG